MLTGKNDCEKNSVYIRISLFSTNGIACFFWFCFTLFMYENQLNMIK